MPEEQLHPENVVVLELNRGSVGLGFNIRGGTDLPHIQDDCGIFVAKIRPDGSAAADNRLREGDKILEVNGRSLNKVTHHEAVNMFMNAGEHITMKILPGEEERLKKLGKMKTTKPVRPTNRHIPLMIAVGVAVAAVAVGGVLLYRSKKMA